MRAIIGKDTFISLIHKQTKDYMEMHTEYIVAIIIFNKLLSSRSIKNKKKRERFYLTLASSFSDALLSSCRCEWLTYIIVLLSEELLTFLARQVY